VFTGGCPNPLGRNFGNDEETTDCLNRRAEIRLEGVGCDLSETEEIKRS
jgi:hypothetical protein